MSVTIDALGQQFYPGDDIIKALRKGLFADDIYKP